MKRKTMILLAVLILLTTVLTCCEGEDLKAGEYNIYYANKDGTKIVPVEYEPGSGLISDKAMINEMIVKLSQEPGSVDFKRSMPQNVEILSWSLENRQLILNFNNDYASMDNVQEVLCRAAVVRTLTQVENVDCVSFYVGEAPLMDKNGNPVGLMTSDSFIENPGEQINSIQTSTITLYFSNPKGDGLVKENQKVHHSSNISMEKLVMEHLLKGPSGKDAVSAVPAGTRLVGVSVLDGVCFVNLDEGFLNHNFDIAEGVVIYSIVDSLVELPNVNKVQISVNGDTSITYREKFSLSSVYERNLDYLVPEELRQQIEPAEKVEPVKQETGGE